MTIICHSDQFFYLKFLHEKRAITFDFSYYVRLASQEGFLQAAFRLDLIGRWLGRFFFHIFVNNTQTLYRSFATTTSISYDNHA